jgi:hypothetical protein
LSPLLFSMYVDPLKEEPLTEDATNEIDGDFLSPAGVAVPCLLFADDLVLLSSTRAGLQAMLGTLERFSRRTGLTVNRGKTKVVVFGAQLQRARQKGAFYIDGGAIETMGSYRYLGVEVSCSGRWTPAVQALSTAGLRATHALRQRCTEIPLYDPGLRAGLCDGLVRPILLHGAEIWGATRQIGLTTFENQERDPTEQVHRSFFKSLLGVRASTSGVSILGEFGRFPLFVDRVKAISLYYNRLLRLRDSGRLVSLAFEDSVRLAEELEFMLHSTTLPERCSPPTLVRGWFDDAMAILGRAYRRPCIRSFPECDTSLILSSMQRQYLTGPHRQGVHDGHL